MATDSSSNSGNRSGILSEPQTDAGSEQVFQRLQHIQETLDKLVHSQCEQNIKETRQDGRSHSTGAKLNLATTTVDSKNLIASKHIGFLGSGKMAQAMAKGFLSSGMLKGTQVTMTDRLSRSPADAHLFEPIKLLETDYGIEYLQTNDVMVKKCDVIFACVKPRVILPLLQELGPFLTNKLVISIAAGITTNQIAQVVSKTARILRIMPNLPCLVQAGTGIFSRGPNVSNEDVEIVKLLCNSSFSVFEEIPESLINSACGISGSGPAYIFMLAEALTDGGVRMGVPRDIAQKLAINTILGSAVMMQQTGVDPNKLKNDVCSPGGTSIAAIHTLERGAFRATIMDAVEIVANRGDELGEK